MSEKLPLSFYAGPDVVGLARQLIGKYLFTQVDGVLAGGKIVETEAYRGEQDMACHAHGGRRTARTEVMYQQGGVAYVYLIYGMHALFNVITNVEGKADAVLIRAIEPVEGIPEMLLRRQHARLSPRLTAGPGVLTKALGITTSHCGTPLTSDLIWLEDRQEVILEEQLLASPRVGVAYAGADAGHPWRFRLHNSPWTSPAK